MGSVKKLVLVIAALLLGACGNGRLVSPADRVVHHVISGPAYVAPDLFRTAQFAPPPAFGTEAQKADLAAVLDWQSRRTAADCSRSQTTADANYDYFWGDKPPFPSPLPAEVKAFFTRLDYDTGEALNVMKKRFARLRPFKQYGEVMPCIRKSSGYSYPSGHSSYSRVFAEVLGDIVPARRGEFLKRADEVASDRVVGGVHYPTDIAAGKEFGEQFHAELLKSRTYREDVERMKAFLTK